MAGLFLYWRKNDNGNIKRYYTESRDTKSMGTTRYGSLYVGGEEMKLYEIKEAMIDTLDIFLDSEQEEIDKEFYSETMDYLKSELQYKSSNIIKYISNLDSEANSIKDEIERLTKVKKSRERKLESLKGYLIQIMQGLEKTKIETNLGSYGIRKSSALKIFDMNKIPKEYLNKKTEVTVDKREITRVIKSGHEVLGAALIENYSFQIK